jgi:HlyD family secretion protein
LTTSDFNLRLPRPLAAVALLLLAFTANGCRKKVAEAEKPVVTVQAEHPEFGPITQDIEGDATLAPVAQAAIQSKVTAPIKAFYVQRGTRVSAGQVVARLENSDLAAAALDNKGSYTAAQGAYTAQIQATVPQETTQARLDLKQTKATLDLNQSILTAREKLFAQGASPGRDVDMAKQTVVQSQAAYDIAQQKFDNLSRVGTKAAVTTAQGQLESARGKYLGAEAQLGYTSIRTPISGVVTERPYFAGETAPAGTAILTIMDTSVMIAKMHIAQSDAQQLAIGAPATLTVPGMDAPVPASVSLISPALDSGSTTVEIWLKASNKDGALKAGSAVHASINGHTIQHALLIPTDAIQRSSEGAGKIVMVMMADGTAHKKNIVIGIQTTEKTQITDGLTPADIVINGGGYGLDEGTKVKIGPAEAKTDSDTPGAAKPDVGTSDSDKPDAAKPAASPAVDDKKPGAKD